MLARLARIAASQPFISYTTRTTHPFSIVTNNQIPFSRDFDFPTRKIFPSSFATAADVIMEDINVLMTCPMNSYLEKELDNRFKLLKLWAHPQRQDLLKQHAESIRAVVGNATAGADAEMIEALPKLEIISSFSVGLDKIDLIKCKEKGIRVTNTPDVLTEDVADLAIGLMLAVCRRICECDKYVRKGLWKLGDFKLTTKFSGKTVGIIGLGRIGLAIAKRAEAFGCPISYHSRSEKSNKNYKYYASVIDLALNCDIMVVACALTPETRHIVNREVIDALGPKGILINIGRVPMSMNQNWYRLLWRGAWVALDSMCLKMNRKYLRSSLTSIM